MLQEKQGCESDAGHTIELIVADALRDHLQACAQKRLHDLEQRPQSHEITQLTVN